MEPLDPAWVEAQLSSLPFVVIEGVSNVRSLGNYPSESVNGQHTKPNFVFRSGELSGVTLTGKAQMKDLGSIKKVFDLSSDLELEKFGSAPPDLGPDVEIQRIPVFKYEDYGPETLTRRSKLYASGDVGSMLEVYSGILDNSVLASTAIFKHIRDKPDHGFLFHCTAGKDRTGILAALILKVSGVNDENISKDYYLTQVGRAPYWEATVTKFLSFPDYTGNKEAVINTLSSRPETMIAFLHLLEEKYGGVENYLKSRLGFSTEDIFLIRRHLLQGAHDPDFQAVTSASGESDERPEDRAEAMREQYKWLKHVGL